MDTHESHVHRLVIVGSGPAGLTAAIYAGRADLEPVVVDGIEPGGQLMITTEVENYPGFPEGIQGPELMERFRAQAARFGTTFIEDEVTSVEAGHGPFRINLGSSEPVLAHAVIVASGASARWLGLESEKRLRGKGVSACATCDGFFFRGKVVAVVGGGDTAMEEAAYLTHHASKVYVIHRRDEFRASKIMQDRVLAHPKIEVVWNSVITEILDDNKGGGVTGVALKNVITGDMSTLALDGVFIAIGHQPNTKIVSHLLPLSEAGYLTHLPDSSKTEIPGLFVAGDVHDSYYRQAITAAGAGCRAAIDAERWLEEQAHTRQLTAATSAPAMA